MLHSIHSARRTPPSAPRSAEAGTEPVKEQPATRRPASPEATDQVHLGEPRERPVAGFGLDLFYGRRALAQARIDQGAVTVEARHVQELSLDFRFVANALPRNDAGEVDVEALVNHEEKEALADALDEIARRGLAEGFDELVRAVDALLDEYQQDLGLHESVVAASRDLLLGDVKRFFEQAEAQNGGAPLMAEGVELPQPLSDALHALHERIIQRRHDVLTASGDISKRLAELTADAREEGAGARERTRLGDFLEQLREAAAARSTRTLREDARERLAHGRLADAPPVPGPGTEQLARDFLGWLRPN